MKRRQPLVRLRHELVRSTARLRTLRPGNGTDSASSPGTLLGGVDEPKLGAVVSSTEFVVRGWSVWVDRPAVAVAVMLDGVLVGSTAVGSERRPDVAAALGNPALTEVGWKVRVDARRLEAGGLAELSVMVWGDPVAPPVELDRFTLSLEGSDDRTGESPPAGFLGSLDLPLRGGTVGLAFSVMGWVWSREAPISRIDVLVNGRWSGCARLGLARPDVVSVVASAGARISGFEHWIDLSSVAPGEGPMTLQVIAHLSGREPAELFERVVHVMPDCGGGGLLPDLHVGDRVLRVRERATIRGEPLDLVVFTHQLDYGGGQLWLEEFLERSGAGKAFACTVIALRGGPLREAMEQRGVRVHVTAAPPVDDPEQYEGRIEELMALVARGRHSVALVNTAPVFSGADVANRLGIPTVWAIHESLTPEILLAVASGGRMHPEVRDVFRRTMAGVDALVFEAEATRAMYAPWAGTDRAIVVPYGVNTNVIVRYCSRVSQADARLDIGVPADARVILVMGTIEPRKAQTRIAQAFAQVADDHPDWMLIFVGDTRSEYSDALQHYLSQAGLHDRCRVMPVDNDAYRWYRAADVLLSASDMESLPRSMLETMCFGTPVLAASVFGVPELLQDGRTGFLFEANDLEAMVGALRRVLALDHDELAAVGDAGRRHVLERYDSARYSSDITALLEGITRDATATPGEILSNLERVSQDQQRQS